MEYAMTWKDKLEIGLKDDAPFRRDNLPEFQQTGETPPAEDPEAERSPEEPGARAEAARESLAVKQQRGRRGSKRTRRTPRVS
jgi:hypothetical protein